MEFLKILEEDNSTKLNKLYGSSSNYYIILSVLYVVFWIIILSFNLNILSIITTIVFILVTIINSLIVINVKFSNKRVFLFIPLVIHIVTMCLDVLNKNIIPIFTYYLPMITLLIQLYLIKKDSYNPFWYQKFFRVYYILISVLFKFSLLAFVLYYIGFYLFNNAINIINPLAWHIPFYYLIKTPMFWVLCFYTLVFVLISDIFSKSIVWFFNIEDLEYSVGSYEEQYGKMIGLFANVSNNLMSSFFLSVIVYLPIYAYLHNLELFLINKILFFITVIIVAIGLLQYIITLILSFIPTLKYIFDYKEYFTFENFAINAILTQFFEMSFDILILIYLYKITF